MAPASSCQMVSVLHMLALLTARCQGEWHDGRSGEMREVGANHSVRRHMLIRGQNQQALGSARGSSATLQLGMFGATLASLGSRSRRTMLEGDIAGRNLILQWLNA